MRGAIRCPVELRLSVCRMNELRDVLVMSQLSPTHLTACRQRKTMNLFHAVVSRGMEMRRRLTLS
jgi:hypothetical protein